MILREVIQRVQTLYSRGIASDDSRLSSRHIYNKLVTVRSRVLANRAKDKQKINQWNYQTLPCVELEIAPVHDCPCIPSATCKILRSKYKIPRVLTDKDNHLIQSVTTLDGSMNLSPTTWEAIRLQKGNKYTKETSGFFIRNGHLYVSFNTELDVVTMTALFTNPEEADSFPSFCASQLVQDCTSPLDREFPVDGELLDGIIEMASQELIMVFKQIGEDKINNASDDSGIQQQNRRIVTE